MSLPLGRIRLILILMVPLTLLNSCNSSSNSLAEPKASALVQAFVTASTTPVINSQQIVPESSATPSFTTTPISYAIVVGDTLLAIAERNGISLDDLLLANPAIDARFLSIGQEIFIPGAMSANEGGPELSGSINLSEGETTCFESVAGELWCFFLVKNDQSEAVENAAALIQLFSSSGELLNEKNAYGQLQKLDSGAKMPLVAYWNQAPAAWLEAQAQLTTAFLLDDPSLRYLELELIDFSFIIFESGKSALVSAAIRGPEIASASSIKVLAIAYADDGQVIGTRRLTLNTGETSFSFTLYSLGPSIAELDLLIEGLY